MVVWIISAHSLCISLTYSIFPSFPLFFVQVRCPPRQFHDAIPLRRPLSIHYLFHLLFSPFPPEPAHSEIQIDRAEQGIRATKKQVRRSFEIRQWCFDIFLIPLFFLFLIFFSSSSEMGSKILSDWIGRNCSKIFFSTKDIKLETNS